jgi:hypothetical protein
MVPGITTPPVWIAPSTADKLRVHEMHAIKRILTNQHVVDGCSSYQSLLATRKDNFEARLLLLMTIRTI